MEHKNAWLAYDEPQLAELEKLATDYIDFISANKTERECVATAIEQAREAGYVSLDEARAAGKQLVAGDKVYAELYGKTIILAHIGSRPMQDGLNILGAHVDSPRLDIKQNPLYESGDLALLDTHYYGGIKKYQWVTLPLAIHGVIAKKDGSVERVNVGEDAGDPVFCITDLLIHLANDQMQKKASEVVEGENLDVLAGGRPAAKAEDKENAEKTELEKLAEKEPVKATMLALLAEKYGMEEEDFLSSELEVVPAGHARELGFDRSMVLGYGHDDRVCAFPSLVAQLEANDLEKTGICILVDKEEIGSVGATGMRAHYFENAMAELLALTSEQYSDLMLRRALAACRMLSCDVSAGYDPLYASCFEKKNAAYLGRGVCYNKYTGSRGKSGSNDANAEFLGHLRKIMDDNHVAWQTAELGKVDVGGGGTIAYICALYGMEVVDSGVPVLSMHAPLEIISKADLYEAVKAYHAFMQEA